MANKLYISLALLAVLCLAMQAGAASISKLDEMMDPSMEGRLQQLADFISISKIQAVGTL